MLALAQAEHFLFLFEFELERLLGESFAGPVAAGLDFKRQGCLSRTYRGGTFGFHPFAAVEVEPVFGKAEIILMCEIHIDDLVVERALALIGVHINI